MTAKRGISTRVKGNYSNRNKARAEFGTWCAMVERCYYPRHIAYADYGGRGIRVCNRWRNSFEAFVKDMGPKPSPAHSIDRYPNSDGHYELGNCRWATPREQRLNQRPQNDSYRVKRSWDLGKRSRISHARLDLTGRRFGKLTVLKLEGSDGTNVWWSCHCLCGKAKIYTRHALTTGGVKSCGCAQFDALRQIAKARTSEEQRARALKGWEKRRNKG